MDLIGIKMASHLGGSKNKHIAGELAEYDANAIIGWPGYSSLMGRGSSSTVKNNWPVLTQGRALTGFRAPSYEQDFYHRIHITPLKVALGNVSSNQGFEVVVWNAYLTPKTVNSLAGIEGGMTVTPPAPMPFKIEALQETSWQVEVLMEGNPQIDVVISWNFEGVNAPSVHITGMRVTMWPFLPDWSEPITERLEWATDILASNTGAEQRRALRLSPRRYYRARFIFFKDDRQHFEMCMASNAAGTWALPLWVEMQALSEPLAVGAQEIKCITKDREFHPGTMIILRGADVGDIFTIETAIVGSVLADKITLQRPLQQAWPSGARLYPARSARFSSLPTVLHETDEAITTELAFESIEPNEWQAKAPSVKYRGFPVFENRPDEAKNLTSEYLRMLQTIDTVAGIPVVRDTAKVGFYVQEHAWFMLGAQELSDFKKLIYSLRGKQVPVWVPTHKADVTLARDSSNDVLYIKKIGFSAFGFNSLGKRDIYIDWSDDTLTSMHRITKAVDVGDGTERLNIEPNLPQILNSSNCGRISFLALCRLDSDSITFEHVSDVSGLTRAKCVWRSLRDELERPQLEVTK